VLEDVANVKIDLVRSHFRVDKELARKISKLAQKRGVSSETLVNLWLQEKVS
jgi:predicted HicB family RNase H-like nuclease